MSTLWRGAERPDVPADRRPLKQTEHPRAVRPGRVLATLIAGGMYRLRVHGRDNVPPTGPVLLAINHRHFLDGPVVFGTCSRPARFLIKAEMFTGPLGGLLRQVGQIPVRRGVPDRGALQTCLNWLRQGQVLGIFPEGTRGAGDFTQVRDGLTWLALRTQAPVVPVVCFGIVESMRDRTIPKLRSAVDVAFGEPFDVTAFGDRASRRVLAEAATAVRDRLVEHHATAARLTGWLPAGGT